MLKQLGSIQTKYPPPPLTLRILGFLKTYITYFNLNPCQNEKKAFCQHVIRDRLCPFKTNINIEKCINFFLLVHHRNKYV